jgi:predicted deacylase
MAFGPDLMWVHPTYSPGRTIHYMLARNRPAIYAEAPGGEHLDLGTVERYVEGVRRVLGELDMVDVGHVSAEERNTPTVVAGGGNLDKDVIRFSAGGLFIAAVGAGELVAESQSLGVVQDVRGRVLQDVHALQKGHVMFLRRTALVRPGDVAACIAGDDRPPLATLSR